ncbi:MAG: hypothetical protein JXI33_05285 [Candidatus Aminicenantes bacterium]|nr:hypothetical protein [Candidatus Aminicenantes bacterium]
MGRKKQLLPVLLFIIAMTVPLRAEHVLRAGSPHEPTGIDPAQAWDDISSFYIINIFDTLVHFNPQTRKMEPSLAVSWKTSPDGKAWSFRLRRGVRFHDGTPLDADAVVFTFWRQMDPSNPNRQQDFPLFADIFALLKTVKKIDSYQVQFILSEPFFPFLSTLSVECASIVSPNAVTKTGAGFANQPVGTGPFKLSSWQKTKRLVLIANREYWGGRPRLDKYIDTIEPRGEVLNNYFQQGTLDILHSYSISKMVSYKKQGWIKIMATPYLSVSFIAVNAARPLLKHRRVRQALGYAWDPRAIKLVFQNYVLPIHSLLPKDLITGNPAIKPTGFSLTKAQALLKKEALDGEIELEMLLRKDDVLPYQLFSLYARNLKQVGIKLRLTRMDPHAYSARIAQGDYDLAYSGWIADFPDPDSMIFPLFSEQLQKNGFANIASARRRDLEDLLKAARRERDVQKRQALYFKIDRIAITDGLVIPMYQEKRVIIFNQKIGGVKSDPLGKLFLIDLFLK